MKVVRITAQVPEEPGVIHPKALMQQLEAFCLQQPGVEVRAEVYDPRDREAVGEGP
jgi:hypothetical protein